MNGYADLVRTSGLKKLSVRTCSEISRQGRAKTLFPLDAAIIQGFTFSPQARTVSFVSTSGCDPTVLPPGGVFSSDGRGNPWNGCFREYRIGSRLWKSSPSLVKPDTCGQWARKNLASNTTRIMGDNARPTLQGPFTKTERSSCRHVLAVDCQEVASKGLESPEYKPLMRNPRGGSIPDQDDRLYCQHDFPRRFNKRQQKQYARRFPNGMRLSSPGKHFEP